MDVGGYVNGFKTAYACDWHAASKQFFANNYPDVPFDQGDVREMSLDRINRVRENMGLPPIKVGEIDIFLAGSPCVKLSSCNTVDARDFAAENLLMVETLPKLIRELQPKVVWFENSDRLCSEKNEVLFLEYLAAIENLLPNYNYQIKVMNAIRYGGFQTRSRAMTVLVRNDVLNGRNMSFFPEQSNVDLSKQGVHALLPHVSEFWLGQFEERYKPAVGNIFCTLTAGGHERVKDHCGNIWPLTNEDRKVLTGMQEFDYTGIASTNVKMLLGNMVLRQLSERMIRHIKNNIL